MLLDAALSPSRSFIFWAAKPSVLSSFFFLVGMMTKIAVMEQNFEPGGSYHRPPMHNKYGEDANPSARADHLGWRLLCLYRLLSVLKDQWHYEGVMCLSCCVYSSVVPSSMTGSWLNFKNLHKRSWRCLGVRHGWRSCVTSGDPTVGGGVEPQSALSWFPWSLRLAFPTATGSRGLKRFPYHSVDLR